MASRDVYAPLPAPPPEDAAGVSRRSFLRLGASRWSRAAVPYDYVTERVAAVWAEPEREALLRALEPAAAVVAEAVGPAPGDVLDAGAGDGNVAAMLAASGARVAACDLVPEVVERGRARTGDAVPWTVADVQRLPYPTASFDTVVSAFGFTLAPRPRRTLHELVRVLRPGGRLVLAAWSPRGLPGRVQALVEAVAPLPEGIASPTAWGQPDTLRERLAGLDDVEVRTRTVTLSFRDPDALLTALVPDDLADTIAVDFARLLASCNDRPPEAVVAARYVLATARRP